MIASLPLHAALFAGFETAPCLLLAVSGGPDSTALMLLAARWAGSLTAAPKLHVATVDHRLRPESTTEAEGVGLAARALGLPHAILPWTGDKPATRLQERARAARYGLLAAHAEALGATHLLTAHHADDQAETVLFRMARGSGLGGLAGMRRETQLRPGLVLARPLLGLAKADLVAVCAAAAHPTFDDPSNHDPAFARVTLRARRGAAESLGLDTATLTRLALRLARAEDALEAEAARRLAQLDARHDPARFEANLAPLRDTEAEIVIRVLRAALLAVTPDAAPPRLDRLESLAARIRESIRLGQGLRATLHGVRVILADDTRLTLVPEGQRRRGRGRKPDVLPRDVLK